MTTLDPRTGAWAVATIAGREVTGDLVGFSHRVAVIAFERAQPLAIGDTLRLRLGVPGGDDAAVLGRVLQVMLHRDGRPAAAFTLPDDEGAARRTDTRVAFDERIQLIACDGRVGGDAHQRARAVDLSTSGMSLLSDRELPPMTTVLLRFTLPRASAPLQFRAQVRWCRPQGNQYLCGTLFTGLRGTQLRDIASAVLAISRAAE